MKKLESILKSNIYNQSQIMRGGDVEYFNPLSPDQMGWSGIPYEPIRMEHQASEEIWKLIWENQILVANMILNEIDILDVMNNIHEREDNGMRKITNEHVLYRIVIDTDDDDFKGILIKLSKESQSERQQSLRSMFLNRLTMFLKISLDQKNNEEGE